MSTISSRRISGDDDHRTAGGKITRTRRPPPSSRTPYARPPTPPAAAEAAEDEVANPNWLSSLIYPAKVIASGAGKILSFFGNDSEDDEEDEEDDSEYDDDEGDNDGSDKVCSPTSKSVNKHKIEQMVLEETFTREEGDQLIRLIRSRMVDTNGTRGQGTPPPRNAAIMEARKWLQEKRSGSKKKMEAELDSLSQFTRSEKGSPTDMAKSYMQNRPAWGSPSLKHIEFGSPSALGALNFKEETSTLRSSELKRSSFAAGSWNLLDEIRRVRSKATEELLSATPSTKTSLSIFSPVNNRDILEIKGNIEAAGQAESTQVKPDHVLHDAAANSFLRDSQDGNAGQSAEHQELPEAVDMSVLKDNKDNEVNESRTTTAENGSVVSGHRLSSYVQGQNAAEDRRPSEKENGNLVNSTEEQQDVHVANILPDPIDVPCTTDTQAVLNGSQHSSSLQEEDVSQDLSQPTLDVPADQPKEAQKEKKSRGYARRGRGRGK